MALSKRAGTGLVVGIMGHLVPMNRSRGYYSMYKQFSILCLFLMAGVVFFAGSAAAHELSGYVEGEVRLFPENPNFLGQRDQSASFAIEPEYYHEFESGSSFIFVPFFRLDSADSKRTHFDVRELNYLWLHDDFELRLGVGKVFWGVTEVLHLVDIINQTDLVENIDGEQKLGQPMVNLSIARDWGTLDLFVLPFFRERTFPGQHGRLRFRFVIDTDQTVYESAAEEWHTDWSARYSHTLGDWDFGIHYFIGTSRDPSFTLGTGSAGNPVILPVYQQIQQTGLDVSYVAGNWLWKLEASVPQRPGRPAGIDAQRLCRRYRWIRIHLHRYIWWPDGPRAGGGIFV